uniref:Ribosomal protein L34 n=1 Tax=Alsidium seaforthii TaxID=2007182 RepID=A0A1Z1MDK3_9FLOR|nr:ribosomal protein L34 [Bryothamnion seaforthii]ARW63834.1 ribosomal protein L34 [Bryothamnion seaforthii]
MNTGTKIKKKRKSGFLVRMRTKSGQKIINAKRSKKRKYINK